MDADLKSAIAAVTTAVLGGLALVVKRLLNSGTPNRAQLPRQDLVIDKIERLSHLVGQLQEDLAGMAEREKLRDENATELADDWREQATQTQMRESIAAKTQDQMLAVLNRIGATLDQMLAVQVNK